MSWTRSAFWSKVIIFITVLLAVVFFVSALLHLLIRYLLKQRSRTSSNNYPQISTSSGAFQRQLQQLFQLHDSGLDQAHVDSLPVFSYKDIVGSKEPFDCAVCLCEYSDEDNLRLLPLCSHAFHIDCIDTWLLSNSTCPLCRGVILSENQNPVFYFEDSKETEDHLGTSNGGFLGVVRPNEGDNNSAAITEKRVFSVRLGKFKNITNSDSLGHLLHHHHHHHENEHIGETSNSHLDARRCYSMGSFQYVVADLDMQVALCSNVRDRNGAETERPLKGRGGLYGNFTIDEEQEDGDGIGKKINSGAKGESFSISKIWLWSKKGQSSSGSYLNAVNFNLP